MRRFSRHGGGRSRAQRRSSPIRSRSRVSRNFGTNCRHAQLFRLGLTCSTLDSPDRVARHGRSGTKADTPRSPHNSSALSPDRPPASGSCSGSGQDRSRSRPAPSSNTRRAWWFVEAEATRARRGSPIVVQPSGDLGDLGACSSGNPAVDECGRRARVLRRPADHPVRVISWPLVPVPSRARIFDAPEMTMA
jgi:hypothetical protein